ncbi:enoyl-CoA hydratase [Tistrella bauzanensis]|uniref:Enoyl-CoA hydratase domain-containing protein 3, mitochondrial n=1 Tax=Tistrella bauzanensis TaxID=657419 RepID=A0ABQ1IB91_9PROT|nr:enoyl-CoA hydratase [Tistrella bauzanensis]GGB30627.1 enoyl-CoA hydratase [Tistrella bauzanensis]
MTDQTPARTQAAAADTLVRLDIHDDGVAVLTLNRPAQRNALSLAMMSAIEAALDEIARNPAARAVVLRGEGPAFCSGHDLKEMRADPDKASHAALFAQCSRMMTRIVRLPKPVIAEVGGIATAAGCQLVASCDLAVAATTARFATPGVNLGLFCSTPMVALSRAVGRKHAMEMLLMGEMADAETAHRFGLVNRVVAPEALSDTTMGMARLIASKSPLTLRTGKEAFYAQVEMTLDDAYAYASKVMTDNMQTNDAVEGIDAFLGKRKPIWQGR